MRVASYLLVCHLSSVSTELTTKVIVVGDLGGITEHCGHYLLV